MNKNSNSSTTRPTVNCDRRLVKVHELVELTGKSSSFWANLRHKGAGPKWIYLGYRSVAYWLDDVYLWLDSRIVESTAEAKYLELNPRMELSGYVKRNYNNEKR